MGTVDTYEKAGFELFYEAGDKLVMRKRLS